MYINKDLTFSYLDSGAYEKKEWLSLLNEAIEKYRGSNSNAGVVVAPVWDPDSQSTNCSLCNANFTLLFRRHHCRNCGKLVCTNCSSKKYHLEHVSQGLVRVCDPCFDTLVPASAEKASVPSTQDEDAESSDDSDTSERFHEREMLNEDDLDDYNDFEMELARKGIPLTSDVLKGIEENKQPPPPPPKVNPGRASFLHNLTSSLAAAASALRPTTTRPNEMRSNTTDTKKPTNSPSNNDVKPASPEAFGESPRPPRRPRRPNAIRLIPLTEEQLNDISTDVENRDSSF